MEITFFICWKSSFSVVKERYNVCLAMYNMHCFSK